MKTAIRQWGNSLAIRLPAIITREANLHDGSVVDLDYRSGVIVLTPVRQTRYDLNELLANISVENVPQADVWGAPIGSEAAA